MDGMKSENKPFYQDKKVKIKRVLFGFNINLRCIPRPIQCNVLSFAEIIFH